MIIDQSEENIQGSRNRVHGLEQIEPDEMPSNSDFTGDQTRSNAQDVVT